MQMYRFDIKKHREETKECGPADDLAYRRLIDYYYIREGPLPKSLQEVAEAIEFDVEVVAGVLEAFFEQTPDGWRKADLDAEIARSRRPKEAKSRLKRIKLKAP